MSLADIRKKSLQANQDDARIASANKRALEFLSKAPSEYTGKTLASSLDNERFRRLVPGAEHQIKQYINNPTPFALLHGNMGLGKSVTATALAAKLIRYEYAHDGDWISFTDMIHRFSWEADTHPVENLAKPAVLVLDDMGAGTVEITDNQRKSLFDLIERRYNDSRKYTIITSNLALNNGPGSLADLFTERGWDRVQQNLTRFEYRGESLRQTLNKRG